MRTFTLVLYAEQNERFANDAFQHIVGNNTTFLGYRAKLTLARVIEEGRAVELTLQQPG